ncbi:MAG TPA: Abi-alpha family protein [Pseudonocardiaceae bacterium]|nr:Abi-alpha family protein [Pseudonocardiaceae bacterium]
MLANAGRAAGWLVKTGWRVTRALPGGEQVEDRLLRAEETLISGLHRAEHTVVGELRRRREPAGTTAGFAWRVNGNGPFGTETHSAVVGEHELVTLVRPMNGQVEPLRAGMAELLSLSASADAARSRDYLYASILRQLVPDEARILAALADGRPRPVVHVMVRSPLGAIQRAVLENASTVGRDAGVAVPEHVPFHLTRLHRLDLVDIGDEDTNLTEQYAILAADDLIRDAERQARQRWRGGAKLIRRTITMSALGNRFWAECDPLA